VNISDERTCKDFYINNSQWDAWREARPGEGESAFSPEVSHWGAVQEGQEGERVGELHASDRLWFIKDEMGSGGKHISLLSGAQIRTVARGWGDGGGGGKHGGSKDARGVEGGEGGEVIRMGEGFENGGGKGRVDDGDDALARVCPYTNSVASMSVAVPLPI
jgi:hypothetical protein